MHKSFAIASLAALAAFALPGGALVGTAAAQAGLCSQPNQHCIAVTVGKDAAGALQIEVDVQELTVKGANHVIFWRLNNAGAQKYSFAVDGIAFKSADGRGEFKCAPQGNGGILFKCIDPNRLQGKFEYAISLKGLPPVPVLDPWVVNR